MPRTPKTPAEPSRPLGRPTKFTSEVRARLEKALKAGASHVLAAQYAGIAVSTFYMWKQKGEEGDPEFQDFLDVIGASEAEGAIKILEKIDKAVDEDWRAGAWILERRFPEMYGKQRLEITGKDGGPIDVKAYLNFSPDVWDTDDTDAPDS